MNEPLEGMDDAATPLTSEEQQDLIPSYISLRRELNEAEQANILEAEQWAFARRRNVPDLQFLSTLHKRMFGRVWRWAGNFRNTERNIGVAPAQIRPDLQQLVNDCNYWIKAGTYPPDEIAARFHHRLTSIHSFPNGNGRHARLATDLLLAALGRPRFSWGRENLVDATQTRKAYVASLRAADQHNIGPLLDFVRS
ncbi:MAG TPA: mobile mystery protein B [Gammaproteobacteria bacterium]|nr:mobile mystery protein B [Gammaproteobacteria bacterium]